MIFRDCDKVNFLTERRNAMKKLITLVGRLVLFAAAIFAASPCLGKIYEPELPESMYKEQKIKERGEQNEKDISIVTTCVFFVDIDSC